jgi:hypothetical protein
MQAQVIATKRSSNKAAGVYGARMARMAILRRYCEENHPVVQIERDLIEMARAKLQELMSVSSSDRTETIREIRRAAIAKILASEEDDKIKASALLEINGMAEEIILPLLH